MENHCLRFWRRTARRPFTASEKASWIWPRRAVVAGWFLCCVTCTKPRKEHGHHAASTEHAMEGFHSPGTSGNEHLLSRGQHFGIWPFLCLMHQKVKSVGRPSPRSALKPQLNLFQLGTEVHVSVPSMLVGLEWALPGKSVQRNVPRYLPKSSAELYHYSMSCGRNTSWAFIRCLCEICMYFVALNLCLLFPGLKINSFGLPVLEPFATNSFQCWRFCWDTLSHEEINCFFVWNQKTTS